MLVVLYESLRADRVRLVNRPGGPADRYLEIEGAADLVVECVSDGSVGKATRRLLGLYHRAGVAEYWLVDARRPEAVLAIHRWAEAGYERLAADAAGFVPSPLLGRAVRLVRRERVPGMPVYRLLERPETA